MAAAEMHCCWLAVLPLSSLTTQTTAAEQLDASCCATCSGLHTSKASVLSFWSGLGKAAMEAK